MDGKGRSERNPVFIQRPMSSVEDAEHRGPLVVG